MAISLVASVSSALGPTGGTSAAMDTTGATLLVVSVSSNRPDPIAVSDSKGNSYTGLTLRSGAGPSIHRLFYKLAPTVGTGHTISVSGTNVFVSLVAAAFSGVGSYDKESGATGPTPRATGSVTPAANDALLFTGLSAAGATATTPAGYTGLTPVAFGPGNNYQAAAAYLVQTTAAASNPSWAWAGGTVTDGVVGVAVFLPTVAGPTETRVTQDSTELLSLPVLPASRVTQDTVETLSLPVLPASVVTQAAIELLSSTATTAPTESRTTQLLAEVVSFPVADGRLTQLLAEVVSASGPPPTESRVTQLLAEVVSPVPAIPTRVTALSVDVFREVTLPSAATQLAAEVSLRQVVPARETQQAIEVFETVPAEARHTHEALEVHRGGTAKARVTQLVVEVFLIPPPCVPGPFPVDDVPAGGSCPAGILD